MEEMIPIFLFAMIGSVMILRPVTKKLGLLIEALAQELIAWDSWSGSSRRGPVRA